MVAYSKLNEQDKKALLEYPALISLLAAKNGASLDNRELRSVLRLNHIKTFSSDPMLSDYFTDLEMTFEKTMADLNRHLPAAKEEREQAIHQELARLEVILAKLGVAYASVMHKNMRAYAEHVSKAHRNVLEYFVLPMPIKGITD
jgi:hypothetical protein